jgi:hypothetical protein
MKECILLFILQPYTGPSTPETSSRKPSNSVHEAKHLI